MGPSRHTQIDLCNSTETNYHPPGMASDLTDKDVIAVAQFTGDACEDWQSFLIGLFVALRRAVRPGTKVTAIELSHWTTDITNCCAIYQDAFNRGASTTDREITTLRDRISTAFNDRRTGIGETPARLGMTFFFLVSGFNKLDIPGWMSRR